MTNLNVWIHSIRLSPRSKYICSKSRWKLFLQDLHSSNIRTDLHSIDFLLMYAGNIMWGIIMPSVLLLPPSEVRSFLSAQE